MTTPRDGVPVIPGQTEVELPERDATEVMSPAEEAALVGVIENATDADFVEVTRPEAVVDPAATAAVAHLKHVDELVRQAVALGVTPEVFAAYCREHPAP